MVAITKTFSVESRSSVLGPRSSVSRAKWRFGWIDGLFKPGGESFYGQRFSPRRSIKWSALKCSRYARLERDGKTTRARRAKAIKHMREKNSLHAWMRKK